MHSLLQLHVVSALTVLVCLLRDRMGVEGCLLSSALLVPLLASVSKLRSVERDRKLLSWGGPSELRLPTNQVA